MPKPKTYQPMETTERAMARFWAHGYNGSAISDLVAATGVARHGLYQTYGDKAGLFAAAARRYTATVVTPAFGQVEASGAGLAEIDAYFRQQIDLAEQHGLPGPGCLMANTMTEQGPHDPTVMALVHAHLDRLTAGFRNALSHRPDPDADAWFLTVSTQGLWSVSRTVDTAAPLHAYVDRLMTSVGLGPR